MARLCAVCVCAAWDEQPGAAYVLVVHRRRLAHHHRRLAARRHHPNCCSVSSRFVSAHAFCLSFKKITHHYYEPGTLMVFSP